MLRIFPIARFRALRLVAAAALGAALLAAVPAQASMERARAAQARGDLRAAQIEFRNAVRNSPNSAEARAALAQASLDVGDTDTAEKEARAALERGYDRAAGTALLIRAYLGRNRSQELLRDFPAPDANTPPAVAAQILVGRGHALLNLDRRDEARAAIAQAVRLAPGAAEPHLAAGRMALVDNDRAAAIAATDQALAANPNNIDALLRKGTFQFEAGEFRPAVETFGKVIAQMPGNIIARTRRAEAHFRLNDIPATQADVDAALRTAPGNPTATYLRAVLQARAQDWRAADETLTRMGPALQNFADGFLLQATVKNALGQTSQAEDAARRHVARRPDDPRGARLLAALELAAGKPDAAAGTLDRVATRGTADVETLDLLARAHLAMGRAREAAQALERAAIMAPDNADIQSRLALAQLASGNGAGAVEAAEAAMRLDPTRQGMHQILAAAALNRGDLAAAERELGQVPANLRDSELSGIIDATIRLVRVDLPGARTAFETILRNHPNSTRARLGLARVAAMQGNGDEAEKLFGEVLSREPGNGEALGRLVAAARAGSPRAAEARAVLERAQAANPGEPTLALAVASVLLAANEPAKAVAILDAEPLRARRAGTPAQLMLAEAYAAQEKWDEAIAAARTALAAEPENVFARQQLALLLTRRRDFRAAETLVRVGLNAQPANPVLQGTLLQIVREERGLDAALEAADRLAREPAARPASLVMRGDLLMAANPPRAEEAAQAFAASYAIAPSRDLALRQAGALTAAGKLADAAGVLETWLAREPNDLGAASTLAQLEITLGRNEAAERRMRQIVEAQPSDAISLNNLAWTMQGRADPATAEGKATLAEARLLAERAYFLGPSPETSDTLGWILAKQGETQAALPLLRQALGAAVARRSGDLGMFYRVAYALRALGQRAEAIQVLEPVLATDTQFPEREAAARMLQELKAGG